MNKPEQRFKINTRVKLREGVDPSLYGGYSRTGNEGWIRKRKRDRYGYPQVLIEWDKDHWAYNGQEDGWTWEGQFEAVEENKMSGPAAPDNPNDDRDEKVREVTETFVRSLFGVLGQQAEERTEPEAESEPAEDTDDWDSLASQAAEALVNSPAYVLVALEHLHPPVPGAPPMIIPRVFHAAKKPDYALIAQSQLGHVLVALQDETIAGVLQQRVSNEDA